jgi:hypothetical protein
MSGILPVGQRPVGHLGRLDLRSKSCSCRTTHPASSGDCQLDRNPGKSSASTGSARRTHTGWSDLCESVLLVRWLAALSSGLCPPVRLGIIFFHEVVNLNLSDETTSEAQRVLRRLELDGFAVVPGCLDDGTAEHLCKEFRGTQYPQRNLLSIPSIRQLAASKRVREVMEAVLGSKCFAVRGIFFNKTQSANWKVVWHQDLTISVRERRDVDGFRSWAMKDGVLHVQPPAEVMRGMLAIRLHLDESGPDNGPLRVIADSHKQGRLSAEQVASLTKEAAVTCCVPKDGALLMRPLLLHASSRCVTKKPRRVIHLEFAATELPQGLEWYERL